MSKIKKLLSVVLAVILSFSVAMSVTGCATTGRTQKGVLTIQYFEGGYGTEWLE